MAYRRRRSFKRFFRSKRKGVSWSKETLQIMSGFSPTPTPSNPANSITIPIVTNSGTSGSLNITNSIAVRTVKNFVINGAFLPSNKIHELNPDKPSDPDKPQSKALISEDQIAALALDQGLVNQMFSTTPVTWALIYVPQGVSKPYLSNGDYASIYEPNQNVIDSGVWMPSAGPLRIKSRMARKLHTGDSVYFCAYQWYPNLPQSWTATPDIINNLVCTISFCTKCN